MDQSEVVSNSNDGFVQKFDITVLENVLDCSEASKTCSCEGANTNACAHPEVGPLVMLVCPVACAPTNGSTYIATTVVTTNIVSTPSVLPVSTTSAPAVVTLADTGCPRNCGTPEQGGGTCATRPSDGMLICRSCNNNRIRQKGLCLLEVHCRARKVQSGILKGQGCQCANPRCHNCKRKATSQGGDTCLVCRDGWYLLNGECIEMCPVGLTMSGISSFRRRCLEPYVCKAVDFSMARFLKALWWKEARHSVAGALHRAIKSGATASRACMVLEALAMYA